MGFARNGIVSLHTKEGKTHLTCLQWESGGQGRAPRSRLGGGRIWDVFASDEIILVLRSDESGGIVLQRYHCEQGLLWQQFVVEDPAQAEGVVGRSSSAGAIFHQVARS